MTYLLAVYLAVHPEDLIITQSVQGLLNFAQGAAGRRAQQAKEHMKSHGLGRRRCN
eukprot:CAMPEP_0115519866 /NCGR_PEP_ID=MMETSP0271-20121206/78667_1 /TAXON_ID=71861 /ORGANISM="Scrippsiella trochoidea, Strain CCMP3099" /LENGTH=55 /DNA_ID=CAMNT_0002950911 /DNA_START=72 /DNA_END=240 /DNA_ORIENTATION=+